MKQSKVLCIVRHAKSCWDYDGIADTDRPLKAKGIRNAYEIARKMKLGNHIPESILSSPADRALHTAVIFTRVFELSMKKIEINSVLYETSAEEILSLIRNSDEDINSLMVCGHNPDMTNLSNHFLKRPLEDVPTSGAVVLRFKVGNWKELGPEVLEAHWLYFPSKED